MGVTAAVTEIIVVIRQVGNYEKDEGGCAGLRVACIFTFLIPYSPSDPYYSLQWQGPLLSSV